MNENTAKGKEDNILEMKDVVKEFSGVTALKDVNFCCRRGEIHALMGENGAGKSTLIKLLSGASFPTRGKVYFDGAEFDAKTPREALERGVAIIYQELNLVGEMNAVENMFLGHEYQKGAFVDFDRMRKETLEILKKMKVDVNVDVPVNELSVAQQQMIEIAKALLKNAKLIVMDEPTATLTSHETENLFEIIKDLKKSGVTMIFISHHLEETFSICDRISILKDGQYMGTYEVKDMNEDKVIRLMVGREMSEMFPPQTIKPKDNVILEAKGITNVNVKDISFQVHEGEILGLAGLVGAGRTELARAIFGADHKNAGEIIMEGKTVNISKPLDAIKNGIGFVTENRKEEGLHLNFSLSYNIMLPNLKKIQKGLFLDERGEGKIADKHKAGLRIVTPNMSALAKNLSGGNQQKVVLAKWLETDCKVLIFDEPTRGIDVGAKAEIYGIMRDMCAQGKAVIMISSELPEVLGMSDRILVMREGEIRGELDGKEATEEKIMKYAMGY